MISVAPKVVDLFWSRRREGNACTQSAIGITLWYFGFIKAIRVMVFRLFSLTMASMGQESPERYLEAISPAKASCMTRSVRIFWRDGLGVSCKKEEKRSTEGIALEGVKSACCRDIGMFVEFEEEFSEGWEAANIFVDESS